MSPNYTSGAGYSLATSATSGDMRLISVVMGASSTQSRESESKQLLSYGFRFFDTVVPSRVDDTLAEARVWMGKVDNLPVGISQPVLLTLAKGDSNKLTAELEYSNDLVAPINKGDIVGSVIYRLEDEQVARVDLVAQQTVEEGGLFKKIVDWFKRLMLSWF